MGFFYRWLVCGFHLPAQGGILRQPACQEGAPHCDKGFFLTSDGSFLLLGGDEIAPNTAFIQSGLQLVSVKLEAHELQAALRQVHDNENALLTYRHPEDLPQLLAKSAELLTRVQLHSYFVEEALAATTMPRIIGELSEFAEPASFAPFLHSR